MADGIVVGIHSPRMTLNPPFGTIAGDKRFVTVGLGAAQLKIDMSHTDFEACADEEIKHDHRVHSTADGQQNFAVFRAERVCFNELREPLQHEAKISFIYF